MKDIILGLLKKYKYPQKNCCIKMDPKALQELASAYKNMYAEAKDESPEKEEEDRKEDDDLAGSPNAKKNGKNKVARKTQGALT